MPNLLQKATHTAEENWVPLSDVSVWVPDSHAKIFSSFASTSWTYLNLKFDSPLHDAAGSKIKKKLGEF
jgi:hypothetical protein